MFDAGPARADLDGTTIGIIDETVGDGNILRFATAKTEDGPAGTETTIGDGNKLVAAK